MIKTLKVTNGSNAKLSTVNTVRKVTVQNETSGVDKTTVSTPIVVKDNKTQTISQVSNVTVQTLVERTIAGETVAVPSKVNIAVTGQTKINAKELSSIDVPNVSSIASNLHTKEFTLTQGIKAASIVSDADKIDVSDQTYTTSEQVTGLSQERPEIILMSEFAPLFSQVENVGKYASSASTSAVLPNVDSTSERNFTAAGKLFDTLYKNRVMRLLGCRLSSVNASNDVISKCSDEFTASVLTAKDVINKFLQVLQLCNELKMSLSIRNTKCDASQTYQKLASSDVLYAVNAIDRQMLSYTGVIDVDELSKLIVGSTFTVPTLLGTFAFDTAALNESWSSTKMWVQTLYELKMLMQYQSDQLTRAISVSQRIDVDASRVNKHVDPSRRFGSRSIIVPSSDGYLRLTSSIGLISDLYVIDRSVIDTFASKASAIHAQMYDGVSLGDNETKMTVLSNFLSQEYRYSRALGDKTFANLLQQEYNYAVVTPDDAGNNNVAFVDAVVGTVPNRIIDIVNGNAPASLMSMAQQVDGSIAVLPLETQYIEIDASTVTPGASYYVDDVLNTDGSKFNLTRIRRYYDSSLRCLKRFLPVLNGVNAFMVGTRQVKVADKYASSPLNNPAVLYKDLVNALTDETHFANDGTPIDGLGNQQLRNNVLWGVLGCASKNPRVLSVLFSLATTYITVGKTSANPSNLTTNRTMIANALLDELQKYYAEQSQSVAMFERVQDVRFTTTTSTFSTHVSMTDAQLVYELTKDGGVIEYVTDALSGILDTLWHTTYANDVWRSMYSGVPETIMSMVAFELVCTIADTYGNVKLDSVVSNVDGGSSSRGFKFNVTSNAPSAVYSNVLTRLDAERARVQSLLTGIVSIMSDIVFKIKNFVSTLSLNGPSTTTGTNLRPLTVIQMNTYETALGVATQALQTPTYVNMLLSEQQLLTALNAISDVTAQLDDAKSSTDVLTLFDDIPPEIDTTVLLDTLYSLFSDNAFKSVVGYNKKILTVGLPAGFSNKCKRRKITYDSAQKSLGGSNKEQDVIKLCITRVDAKNDEIVYKPQTFLFDLSRYPARTLSAVVNCDASVSYDNIAAFVGTRDITGTNLLAKTLVEFHPAKKGTTSAVMSQSKYDFLSTQQINELYRNHAMSFVLEAYVRIMTGISASENAFLNRLDDINVVKSSTIEQLFKPIAANLMSQLQSSDQSSSSVFPLSSNVSRKQSQSKSTTTQSVATVLAAAQGEKAMSAVSEVCKQMASLGGAFSTLADSNYTLRKLLSPRQFDRVFNVMIDPDDFVVDQQETFKTLVGRQAFEALVNQGELIALKRQTGDTSSDEYVGRQHTAGDFSFEKYVVTIETIDGN